MRHNARFLIENLLKHTISEAPGHLQSPNTLTFNQNIKW